MKKQIFLLALCLTLGLGTAAQAANELDNPGFDFALDGWTDLYGFPADVDSTVFHIGPFSAIKTVPTVAGQDYWSQLYQEVLVDPGQPVYASAYIKAVANPESSARAGLILQFYDIDDVQIGTTVNSPQIGGNNDWRLIEMNVPAAPTGTAYVRLSAFVWAGMNDALSLNSKFYFDDLMLDKINKPPAPQTTLLNGNFENALTDWNDLYGYPTTLIKTAVHGGLYAAQKTIMTVAAADYWSQLYQDITCPAGKRVVTTMWIKTNLVGTSTAGFQVEAYNQNNVLIKTYPSTKLTRIRNWTKVTLTILKLPVGTTRIRVSGYIWAPRGVTTTVGGTAQFDDVSVVITP